MDTELVVRAQQGDQRAFERLAVSMSERLHGVAYRILRDPGLAEDATQQALLAMWRHLPTLRDPTRFEAWSYRTLVRACYEEGARARRWNERLALWTGRESPATAGLSAIEDRDLFERLFRRLSVEHRSVIVLHYYIGMTHEEIGLALGVPTGTVKSRLNRALSRLRSDLEPASPAHDTEPQEVTR